MNKTLNDLVDKIYCINLEKSISKKLRCKALFHHLGIKVNFFKAIRDKIPNKGCLLSHKAIINKSLLKNREKILIFEDDIILNGKNIENLSIVKIYNFLNLFSFDIFFLGVVPDIRNYNTKMVFDNIYQVNGICTHAYILSRSGMNKIKDIEYSHNIPLDYYIRDNMGKDSKIYAIYPSIFFQETGYLLPQWVIILGMKFIEWYGININITLRKLLLVILSILILSFYIVIIGNRKMMENNRKK